MTTHLDDTQGLDEALSFITAASYDLNGHKVLEVQGIDRAKQTIFRWFDTEVIRSNQFTTGDPHTFRGDNKPHTEIAVENNLRDKMRQTLIHHGYKQNTKETK